MTMDEQAWELASVIARNETRATTVVAALAESQSVALSSLPLSAYAAEIRRDWRELGKDIDPATLTADVTVIFDRVGLAVRSAVAQGDWDPGDHPPSSFALWLERTLSELHATGSRRPFVRARAVAGCARTLSAMHRLRVLSHISRQVWPARPGQPSSENGTAHHATRRDDRTAPYSDVGKDDRPGADERLVLDRHRRFVLDPAFPEVRNHGRPVADHYVVPDADPVGIGCFQHHIGAYEDTGPDLDAAKPV